MPLERSDTSDCCETIHEGGIGLRAGFVEGVLKVNPEICLYAERGLQQQGIFNRKITFAVYQFVEQRYFYANFLRKTGL